MKRPISLIAALMMAVIPAAACTSAIVAAKATRHGRPLLWKNRDTSIIDNKVEYIAPAAPGELSYVALFNAKDSRLEEAWMGMNEAGFAVMNTASYNLKDDNLPESAMDKEGLIMTKALKSCKTVDDFARLLDSLQRPLGVEANFGVIDASGDGAFFEANNHSYKRFNISDAPDGVLIRTNFSEGGRPGEGLGQARFSDAEYLIRPRVGSITPEFLTEEVSRSFYHAPSGHDMARTTSGWVTDAGEFIPRYKSTATIVIEGSVPGSGKDPVDDYIMWTGIGYPPCAEISPVWCRPEGVPAMLQGAGPDGHSPQGDRVKARRDEVFCGKKVKGIPQIDIQQLVNAGGTGWIQRLVPQNLATYERVRRLREGLDED